MVVGCSLRCVFLLVSITAVGYAIGVFVDTTLEVGSEGGVRRGREGVLRRGREGVLRRGRASREGGVREGGVMRHRRNRLTTDLASEPRASNRHTTSLEGRRVSRSSSAGRQVAAASARLDGHRVVANVVVGWLLPAVAGTQRGEPNAARMRGSRGERERRTTRGAPIGGSAGAIG